MQSRIDKGVAAFVFSAVAGNMTRLAGSSNNPVAGATIATVLFAAPVPLGLMGRGSGTGLAIIVLAEWLRHRGSGRAVDLVGIMTSVGGARR